MYLLNIPPYILELNPYEQVWKYIKDSYKKYMLKRFTTN